MIELGEQPRFIDEAAPAGLEGLDIALGLDVDLGALAARGQGRRHVFLEGDATAERMILRQVNDAEAADTDQPDQLEFAEPRADRQGVVAFAELQ